MRLENHNITESSWRLHVFLSFFFLFVNVLTFSFLEWCERWAFTFFSLVYCRCRCRCRRHRRHHTQHLCVLHISRCLHTCNGPFDKKKKIGRRHTLAIHAVVHNWERAWVISCCKRFGECAHARQRLEIICVFVSLHVYVCPSGKKIIIIFRCRPTDKATQSNNMLQFCTHAQHTNALPRYIYISIPIWPVPYQYAHAHWQRTH